jgi:hypothetical protein
MESTKSGRSSGRVLPSSVRQQFKPAENAAVNDPYDGGGLVLHHARVQLVYWGASWNNNGPLRAQIDSAVRTILSGNYVAALSEYRSNIESGTLAGSQIHAPAGDPPNNFTDNDVQRVIRDMIDGGLLPPPVDNQHLYLMVTPPDVSVDGILGEHWFFLYAGNDGVPRKVHYGWVTGRRIDDYSCTMAHELVESITDPEMDGITFASCPGVDGTCEIGDVCDQCYALPDGTVVQDWYSKQQHRCIRPS